MNILFIAPFSRLGECCDATLISLQNNLFYGVAVHKTGFEKQILWQLPDKGC